MSVRDDLLPVLKTLRLSGVLETLDARCAQASAGHHSQEEFLYRVLCDEVERREAKQLATRLRRANFEQRKTLEGFEFGFNPRLPRQEVLELSSCRFVQKHQNVLLLGPTGTGKSHLAQALGHRACQRGYEVLFISARDLFVQLRQSRSDDSYERRLSRLCSVDVLILDDLGLQALKGDEPQDLYELIRGRYERGSLIVTSNRAVGEWYPMFGDPLLASAAMDRLLHHSQVLVLQGHSYRNPPASHLEASKPGEVKSNASTLT